MARRPLRSAASSRAVALAGLGALLAASAAAGCSHDDAAGGRHGAFARIERPLASGAEVVIHSRWQPESSEPREAGLLPRFTRSFDQVEEGFSFTPVRAPAAGEPAAVAPTRDPAAATNGTLGLRFPAARGAVLWWLPARPETTYAISCSVRRAMAPTLRAGESSTAAEERALVGRLAVVELERPAQSIPRGDLPLPMLEAIFGPRIAERHGPPAPAGDAFARQRIEFTSSERTASVLVILFAGVPGWWLPAEKIGEGTVVALPEGAVDFDDLKLFELPLQRQLVTLRDAGAPSPPAWGAWRRALPFGGELHPALIAVPPTEIRVPLALPAGPFRLRFAYGIAEERREPWGREPIRFFARLETATGSVEIALPRPILRARDTVEDAGWHECRYDGVADGGPTTLTLATSVESGRPCDDVAVFGEPQIAVAAGAAAPRNVVLVSLDTLRPDRLGTYGYRRPDGLATSPRIDRFAQECVVFDEARTLAPYTLPSHTTLLTGLHPQVHGVESYESAARPGVHPFLAQRFADAGYVTAAFTGGAFLAPQHGLWIGFDRWSALDPFLPEGDTTWRFYPHRGDAAFNQAMWKRNDGAALRGWIADHADEPFFLFVHTYAVHNYRPPPALAARFCTVPRRKSFVPIVDNDERTPTAEEFPELRHLYDATIAYADAEVGALLDALRAAGLLERTVVAIVSDHGEELGEHGGFGHGRTLYDEVLRVPLIVRAPGIAPRRDSSPTSLADVAPTLLQLAGLAPLPGGCGRALLPASADDAPPFLATLHDPRLGVQRALILGARKLIEVDRMSPIRPPLPILSAFELTLDPAERVNLARARSDGAPLPSAEQPPELVPLQLRLADLFARYSAERAALGVDVDAPEVINPDLQRLGYPVGARER